MAAGSIVWELLMKTVSFETDTERARKKLTGLKKTAADVAKTIGKGLAAGVSTGTAALAALVVQTARTATELKNAAAVSGSGVEEFQRWSYAAESVGISQEKLSDQLKDFREKVGEFVETGGGGMADFFNTIAPQIGVTADAFQNLSGPQALQLYFDSLEKAGLSTEQMSFYLEGMASDTTALIPLLRDGGKRMAELGDEAQRVGGVMSSDVVDGLAATDRQITQIESSIDELKRAVVTELTPGLLELSNQVLGTAEDFGGMERASTAIANILKTVASAAVLTAGAFNTLGTAIGEYIGLVETTFTNRLELVKTNLGLMGDAAKKVAGGDFREAAGLIGQAAENVSDSFSRSVDDASDVWANLTDNAQATRDAIDAIWSETTAVSDAPAIVAALPEAAVIAANAAKTANWEAAQEYQAMKKSQEAAKKAAADLRKQMEADAVALAAAVATPLEQMQAKIAAASSLNTAGLIDVDTLARAIDQANAEYVDYVQTSRAVLTDGLLSEEDEIRASYERRRQEIIALSEATESERNAALRALSQREETDLHNATLARYSDLLSERERVTLEYQERQAEIQNDMALDEEDRLKYLGALHKEWTEKNIELDQSEYDKRHELMTQQQQLITDGFAGMADIAKAFAGESSAAYVALFSASKGFALAETTIKQAQAIAKAWGENNYWVAAGLTVSLGAQFAGLLSSINSANFSGTRADGGSVMPDRSYLIGERGPEMFMPTEPGVVLSNDSLPTADSGSGQPIRIVNAFDDAHIADYMGSSSAERIIVNTVKRNKRKLGIS